MKADLLCSLAILFLAGCQNVPTQEKRVLPTNSVEPKELKGDYVQNKPAHQKPLEDCTHIVSLETPYYLDGPQQGRPQDGVFTAGTKLKLIHSMGSYSLVESEDNIRAYIADTAIKKL